MVKSALIFGLIAFVLGTGVVLISPMLAPCCTVPLLGLAAGYVAGIFDKPLSKGASSKIAAISGALAGLGAVLGQLVGSGINAAVVGPEGAAQFMRMLGLPASGGSSFAGGYWFGVVGSAICFSIIDILLMAGIGALGGLLWWSVSGKNRPTVETPQVNP